MASRHKRGLAVAACLMVAVAIVLYALKAKAPDRMTTQGASYVDSAACASCHAKTHRDYQHVGMARSFRSWNSASPDEEYRKAARFFHRKSGRYYEAAFLDGKAWQRRYELDRTGKPVNAFQLEVTHIIGSGNHARSYLHRTSGGEMVQLPLTWYTQEQSWGMSPGYDNARPQDFTRVVDDSCLFCHNGYPRNDRLAEGIDCQRCHGPGSQHVERASQSGVTTEKIREAIVNPKRLSAERQLDICMQCHLETTSAELPQMIRRFDRDVFSFRPGEPLGAYMIHFDHADSSNREKKFEIVNQAYRLRQSACFRESKGKLTCSSCHDVHSIPRGVQAVQHHRTKCMQCHPSVEKAQHPELATANCASCHMPLRRTEDAVHVLMTDHLIQRKPLTANPTAPLEEIASPYRGPIRIYYPTELSSQDQKVYVGVASIAGSADVERGISLLKDASATSAPAKALAVLAEGYLAKGKVNEAIATFENVIRSDPSLPKAQYNLGRALEMANRLEEARNAFDKALTAKPNFPEAEYALGNLLVKIGDRPGAAQRYENAIRLRPMYAEAYNNRGNLHAAEGRMADARSAFEHAVRIDPAYAEAYNNLGRVLAGLNRLPEAIAHCKRAVELNPGYTEARYNLARLLQESGATDAALAEYRNLVSIAPQMVEAHLAYGQALGDAGRLDGAIVEFREVLRLRPDHPEAKQNLDMALGMQRGGRF